MAIPLSPSTLYCSLAIISPQDYSHLPKSPSELTPFLTTTIEAAQRAVSSIPAHPSARSATPESHDINKLYKSVKLPTPQPPPGDMKLWKLSAKDGKGVWFARRSVHKGIGFERLKRGLDVEFALGEHGLEGTEKQEVPGGGVDSVRGIGCVERVGGKVVEGSGEAGVMEIFRLAAQFPGPTAAREFVTVCCKKHGREKEGGGRWYMIVSRPVKVGGEIECICPSKEGEGYIRGEYESVELIREVVPEGDEEGLIGESEVEEYTADEEENISGDNEIVEEVAVNGEDGKEGKEKRKRHRKRKHERHHRNHQKEENAPVDVPETLLVPEHTPPSTSGTAESVQNVKSEPKEVRDYPIEWVMLSRSDPGGNVPKWMVERGTPASIVKDAAKFLKWLAGLSDEQISVSPNGGVKEEKGVQVKPIQGEDVQQPEKRGSQSLVNIIFGIASEMLSPIAPTSVIPNIPNILSRSGGTHANNTDDSASVTPRQHPSPLARLSTDAASLQSFSTAAQDPLILCSPPLTPSSASAEPQLTPLTTSSTMSDTAAPPPLPTNDAESKPLSRLLSQKTRLLARLEKSLQKNRKGDDAETKLRQRYEEEVRREEEKYKRDMEKLGRRKEREAQRQNEKDKKKREKRQREKDRKGREKRGAGSSNISQTVKEAKEVVERLTRENEMLASENEELRKRMSVLESEAGHS
ncbi:hypothetical protein EV426DRAFT_718846, partial [Tirmania nivea]